MLLKVLFEEFIKENHTQLMSLNSLSKTKGEYGAQSAAETFNVNGTKNTFSGPS